MDLSLEYPPYVGRGRIKSPWNAVLRPPPPPVVPIYGWGAVAPAWIFGAVARPWTYGVVASHRTVPTLASLPSILPQQRQTMWIDLGNFLAPVGDELTGTPTLTVTILSGFDALAQSRVSAGPLIGTVPVVQGGTGYTNGAILWQVNGCLPGVEYCVEVSGVGRSSGSDMPATSTRFWCEAAR